MGCALGTRMTYILLCEAAPVVFRRSARVHPATATRCRTKPSRDIGASSLRLLNLSLPEVLAKPSQGLVESGLNRELVRLLLRGT